MKKIAIIGDGGWGTALALHLISRNLQVKGWGPDAKSDYDAQIPDLYHG